MVRYDIESSGWLAEDLKYNETLAHSLDTSIRITADGLSFFCFRRDVPADSKVTFVPFGGGDMVEGLKAAFFAHPTLSLPFKTTRIFADDGTGYVLIPDDLKAVATSQEWVAPSINTTGKHVFSVHFNDTPASIETAVRSDLYEFCQRSFAFPHFDHLQRPLVSVAMRYTRREHPVVVMAILGSGYVDLTLAREGQLLLANRFETPDLMDVLYFVTAVWRQFSLDPSRDHLCLYALPARDVSPLMQKLGISIAHLSLNRYHGLMVAPEVATNPKLQLPPEFILDNLCE
ncbi:DUF3822 family protein [Porphyromonas sp.]|uniref:DUF3822 family protein n=1 Tax=Porphyromonas sp. TaxID=1924944 RepID=UPI0026DC6959|nr:DUF3822 family protein [Porphyromonas sp.]MDO4771721.1 DUF3822 family protein [Porphyromonas sp.]